LGSWTRLLKTPSVDPMGTVVQIDIGRNAEQHYVFCVTSEQSYVKCTYIQAHAVFCWEFNFICIFSIVNCKFSIVVERYQ